MKYVTVLATAALAAITFTAHANAAISASATISAKSLGSGTFEYDLTLTNTGTTNIGTYWFAWIPGQDYLSVHPSSETTPTGWNLNAITGGTGGDGFALQWVASTPLTPGNSLSGFSFTSTEAPSSVEGTSAVPLFAGIPTTTAFVYIGAPLTDAGFRFTASAVSAAPEPASLSLLALAAPFLARRKRRI